MNQLFRINRDNWLKPIKITRYASKSCYHIFYITDKNIYLYNSHIWRYLPSTIHGCTDLKTRVVNCANTKKILNYNEKCIFIHYIFFELMFKGIFTTQIQISFRYLTISKLT